jgi:hypothetical protein
MVNADHELATTELAARADAAFVALVDSPEFQPPKPTE